MPKGEKKKKKRDWRVARDPRSNRIYYYDSISRETRWEKPIELADDNERAEMLRKEAEQKEFFKAMERNIRNHISHGQLSSDIFDIKKPSPSINRRKHSLSYDSDEKKDSIDSQPKLPLKSTLSNPTRLVRTISTMDDYVLTHMRRKLTSDDMSITMGRNVRHVDTDSLPRDFKSLNAYNQGIITQPGLRHRNSTSTMYLNDTMAAPDKEATMQCVCTVIRAHLLESAESKNDECLEKYLIFSEEKYLREGLHEHTMNDVPSLNNVSRFFREIYNKSQMEPECIIMSLIYLERLLKYTRGNLCLRYDNWRPITFISMILSSKVWDDLSMWNVDFSQVAPTFTLKRINELEGALLESFEFNVRVGAGEYAKYYFHLRSMAARLGLSTNLLSLSPLDMDGAKKLEFASEEYQKETKLSKPLRKRGITVSEGTSDKELSSLHETGYRYSGKHAPLATIEQLVHSTMTEADGTPVLIGENKNNEAKRSSMKNVKDFKK